MKITQEGKHRIEESIQEFMEELKKLREEKVRAYNLSGDTWHDNPYFGKLEQDERALARKISEAQTILKEAEIITSDSRNMETVDIGSIVKCACIYPDFEEVEIYEIVGHGETDVFNGKIHYESPVAKSILGLHVNDTVSFETPSGIAQYRIMKFYTDWDTAKQDQEV